VLSGVDVGGTQVILRHDARDEGRSAFIVKHSADGDLSGLLHGLAVRLRILAQGLGIGVGQPQCHRHAA